MENKRKEIVKITNNENEGYIPTFGASIMNFCVDIAQTGNTTGVIAKATVMIGVELALTNIEIYKIDEEISINYPQDLEMIGDDYKDYLTNCILQKVEADESGEEIKVPQIDTMLSEFKIQVEPTNNPIGLVAKAHITIGDELVLKNVEIWESGYEVSIHYPQDWKIISRNYEGLLGELILQQVEEDFEYIMDFKPCICDDCQKELNERVRGAFKG